VSHSTISSTELPKWSPGTPRKLRSRWLIWTLLVAQAFVFWLLQWGGHLLVSEDPLPDHADGAVVLQGSFLGERARLAGAVRLLQQGAVDRILLSVPRESYWGQTISPTVESFIVNSYGQEVANHVDFCESGADVDSTEGEAKTLAACVHARDLRSVVLVTSDFHTRRAGIIWRETIRQQHVDVQLSVQGVTDPEFHSAGWWRERRSAKTWLIEVTKLCSTLVETKD